MTAVGALAAVWGSGAHADRLALLLDGLRHRVAPGAVAARVASDGDRLSDVVSGSLPLAVGAFGADSPALFRGLAAGSPLAVAFDGALLGEDELRADLMGEGAVFGSRGSAELVAHLLARSPQKTLVNRLVDALKRRRGGWALILVASGSMVLARDPWGLRTLFVGRAPDGGWLAASETGAIERAGGVPQRELAPGEVAVVEGGSLVSFQPFSRRAHHPCVRELVEFSAPDSRVGGREVDGALEALGRHLARLHPAPAEVVVPLDERSLAAALGFAAEAGVSARRALLGADPPRALPGAVSGRRVALVARDLEPLDQLAAGVKALRRAGARAVHLRLFGPPTVGACPYGARLPRTADPLAAGGPSGELEHDLGLTSQASLDLARVFEGLDRPAEGCGGCWTGTFPVEQRPEVQQGSLF